MPANPLENSGLVCPWCDYNLTGLTSPVCPECGGRFVLAKPGLAGPQRRRSFRLGSPMNCANCGCENEAFMPKHCKRCGHAFTFLERVFGTSFFG